MKNPWDGNSLSPDGREMAVPQSRLARNAVRPHRRSWMPRLLIRVARTAADGAFDQTRSEEGQGSRLHRLRTLASAHRVAG
jgi:hypothetical protein